MIPLQLSKSGMSYVTKLLTTINISIGPSPPGAHRITTNPVADVIADMIYPAYDEVENISISNASEK